MPDDDSCDRPAADDGPDALAELAELSQLVNGLVAGLSRRDATALALVTNLGFSPAEVASALGVSPGAAKVIVHRARRRLQDALTLELMVRRRGAGCDAFAALFDTGATREAGRHVRQCTACATAVSGDVELFAAPASTAQAPAQA
jgi:RNA polymerase sigma-70 factor (ECF subfamily)